MDSTERDSFSTYMELQETFTRLGCDSILVKRLSVTQDNSKNQIYLGRSNALAKSFNLPLANIPVGNENRKYGIKMSWIDHANNIHLAPETSIILYGKKGEMRLSGFMMKCPQAPRPLSKVNMHEYGARMLAVGLSPTGSYGAVITSRDNPTLFAELDLAFRNENSKEAVKIIPLQKTENYVIDVLRNFIGKEHPAVALKNNEEGPVLYRCPQGAGYTLEAGLAICQNGKSGPDFFGAELKTFSWNKGNAKITLATTEPDYGYKARFGTRALLNRYGRRSIKYADRRVFNGLHRINKMNPLTQCQLEIINWDFVNNKRVAGTEPRIILRHVPTGDIVAEWSCRKIEEAWVKKHAHAVYVPYTGVWKDEGKYPSHYLYGQQIVEGEGTDVDLFFARVADGTLVWDPAYEIKNDRVISRSQWRLGAPTRLRPLKGQVFSTSHLPPLVNTLSGFYKTVKYYDLSVQPDPIIIIESD